MKRTKTLNAVPVLTLLYGLIAGCGIEMEENIAGAEDLEAPSYALVKAPGVQLWPSGEIRAHMITANFTSDAQVRALQNRIRRLFGETWGRSANIFLDFYHPVGSKMDVPNGELGIGLNPTQGSDGIADDGYADNKPVLLHFSTTTPSDFIIIHELGHILGFADVYGDCNNQPPGALTPIDTRHSVMSGSNCWSDPADKLQLSHWDEIGLRGQYGRKPSGMIVGMNNQCLDLTNNRAVSGQPLQTFNCHRGSAQTWKYGLGERSLAANLRNASTMEVRNLDTNAGATVQAANQRHDGDMRNQRWRFTNLEIKGFGGKCFDVQFGIFQPGQPVNLVDCNGTAAQRYELLPATSANSEEYQIQLVGTNLCVLPAGMNAGSPLQLENCPTPGTRHYFLRDNGQIRFSSRTGLCVMAIGNDPNVDMSLQVGQCAIRTVHTQIQKQTFWISGNIKSDLGTCLSARGSDFTDGTGAITWHCSRNRDVVWDYYWRQGS